MSRILRSVDQINSNSLMRVTAVVIDIFFYLLFMPHYFYLHCIRISEESELKSK